MLSPITSIPEIAWPAAPNPRTAALLAVLFQLEQTQWLSVEEIRERQATQLGHLVRHAYETVPFYRKRLDAAGLDCQQLSLVDDWERLPYLSRNDIQDSSEALKSTCLPQNHGRVVTLITSGSTGSPVIVHGTGITQLNWQVLTLRDHLWHQRDFSTSFAAIRYVRSGGARYPDGDRLENWGAATHGVVRTGPGYLLNIQSTVEEQAEWLARVNPSYLLSYPSALDALARHCLARGVKPTNLREVRAFGEVVQPSCRTACADAWNVKIADMYSSQEVGYIALQCPVSDAYHIQSESVLVEVVDADGRPCRPGEVGRILVTPLHNFAMPLLRYDIKDFAEVGEPCPCGRGLPTLRRIMGRQRNLLQLPNGGRRWPLFGEGERMENLPPLRQFQLIQRSVEVIEAKVVCDQPLTNDDEQRICEYLQQTLGYPFTVRITPVASIPRHPSGKFEDFVSLTGQGEN